jgi:hypothetical protein
VYAYSKPNEREFRHHFLWRFWSKIPGQGGMCVFDRSWYGRLLVERVEGFATVEQWMRAYDEIVDFERSLVHEGIILVKFWLQVSQDEQMRRFEDRTQDPLALEAQRRGLAQPREAAAVRRRHRGHVRQDRPRARPWNLVSGEQEEWAEWRSWKRSIADHRGLAPLGEYLNRPDADPADLPVRSAGAGTNRSSSGPGRNGFVSRTGRNR